MRWCKTEEFFKLLADKEGRPFIKSLFANLVWTGIEDNARILGLVGGTNHYERVYKRFDEIYRKPPGRWPIPIHR
jgi:NitT/TauT family transport system substrate-binding protein